MNKSSKVFWPSQMSSSIKCCALVDTIPKEGDWQTKTYASKGLKAETNSRKFCHSIEQK